MVLGRITLVCLLFALALPAAATAQDRFVPGQLIVTFAPSADAETRGAAHRAASATVQERIEAIGADVVTVEPGREAAAFRAYLRSGAVRVAERDVVVRALSDDCSGSTGCFVPNDPYYTREWGIQNDSAAVQPDSTFDHDADVDVPYAWSLTQGSASTLIAILDSGIDADHEDLAPKVVMSANFTTSRTTDDKYGHGTAVAGVAAAITNNGKGVAGVGFNASLLNVKVLNDRGISSCSSVSKGITWAADKGAHVINLSLGNPDCSAMASAVDYAWGKGALIAAAAGNDGDSSVTYPAFYANVIAVGATDNSDLKASFSNYGTWVDLAAPGVFVYTTFPNHKNQLGKRNYDYGNGTSMSTPFAAGAAALIWSTVNDENGNGRVNDEVRARLEGYADPIAGTGTYWSNGRLNVCNAAAASATACPLH